MNKNLLHKEVQDFIDKNITSDISKLLFKGSPFEGITIQELVEQIEAKQRSQHKLPTWYATKNIYYPNKLNIEQTSSEITATYKASLVSGNTIIDLTGGFGVDSYAFTNNFKHVTHCEIDTKLSHIAKYNFKVLKKDAIRCVTDNGMVFLPKDNQKKDCIYIDPSRRNDVKGKVFLLKDCLPNVPENLDLLFSFTDRILVKASPMLDISSAISELKYVTEVHVIAVQNDVKELLFLVKKTVEKPILIKTINYTKKTVQTFEAVYKSECHARFSLPKKYLYEPNAAILKAGLFNEVSHQLKIDKLHVNSHLYTSDHLISFTGRRFKIQEVLPYIGKQLKKKLAVSKANITVRNFPETVAQIRKKTKLNEGGDMYLFFTTNLEGGKIVIVCEKC